MPKRQISYILYVVLPMMHQSKLMGGHGPKILKQHFKIMVNPKSPHHESPFWLNFEAPDN